jgi:hypothetical protein
VRQTFEPVEEVLVDQIPNAIEQLIARVIVMIVAIIMQRKLGSEELLYVWFASAGILTSINVARDYYSTSSLNTGQSVFVAAYFLIIFTFISGMLVWLARVLGPRFHIVLVQQSRRRTPRPRHLSVIGC